jgi:hypothetical protein
MPATHGVTGIVVGATDARKIVATRLQQIFAFDLKMRLQCRKTLPFQEYCPSQNWSYNARVLKARAASGRDVGKALETTECKSSLLTPCPVRPRLR